MRILHVVPTYLPATRYGGPIRSVHGLCQALAARGHEVHVFTTNVDGADDSDVPQGAPVDIDGVKVWYFPSRYLRRLYWSPLMGKALAKHAADFDIAHLHSVFLWPTWRTARAFRRAGRPYLLAPRGMLVRELVRNKSRWLKTTWLWLIERHNLRHASAIHVTTSVELEEMRQFGFKLPPAVTLPNGINPDAMTPSDQPIFDQPYALYLGRINWKKGLDLLINAWINVADLELIIAGNDEEGLQPRLEALAADLGIGKRIHFTGPVIGAEKWRLFQDAKLFVLPSQSENFGIAVLEAMAMGCPVLVSPQVGLSDAVREFRCGLIVEREADEIAGAVNRLMDDDKRRMQMGRNGAAAARNYFSWNAIAEQCEGEYEIILDHSTETRRLEQDSPA